MAVREEVADELLERKSSPLLVNRNGCSSSYISKKPPDASSASSTPTNERKAPDGGYGWAIVVFSFLVQATSGGIAFSVGVFYVEWLDAFAESKSNTAWIGSINTGLLFGGGPITSVLVNRFGHRRVCLAGCFLSSTSFFVSSFAGSVRFLQLSYGVVSGFALSMMYVPVVPIVGFYFGKRLHLAMGLAVSGFGAGSLIFSPLLRFWVVTYGWRGAMVMAGGCTLQMAVFASLLRPISGSSNHEAPLFNASLLVEPKFVVLLVNNVLWNIGSLIIYVIVVDYSRGCGNSGNSWLVSVMGLCSLTGRVLIAMLPSCKRQLCLFATSTAVTGIAIVLFPVTCEFYVLLFFAAVYGLFFGIQLGVLAVVTIHLFGLERFNSAYGYLMFANGLGALLGPPIGGALFDASGTYEHSFLFGGGVTIASAFALALIPLFRERTTGTKGSAQ